MGGGEGGNNVVIVQLQHASIEDERQRRGEIGPDFRKQDAGYDDDQRIEEIQRTIPAAGEMDDQADHGHVRDDLQNRLHPLLFPERKQQDVEERKGKPQEHAADEGAQRQRVLRQPRHRQLNPKQTGKDDDADFYQPTQPVPLIECRLHA